MGSLTGEFAQVDDNLAANLRRGREAQGVSQDELAQQMTERGFGFSQATIWKIEQGKRPVKISEAMALADALGLRTWSSILDHPDHASHDLRVQSAHRRAGAAYQAVKDAAEAYLRAQTEVAVAAYQAREAGLAVADLWTTWLSEPAERAVVEARVEWTGEDERHEQINRDVDAVLASWREHGYEPLIDLDAIETGPDGASAGSTQRPAAGVRRERGTRGQPRRSPRPRPRSPGAPRPG